MKLLNILKEIKVLSPSPFRFEITSTSEEGNTAFGTLYFSDKIIAKHAILDQNKKIIGIITSVENYEKLKDRLPKHVVVNSKGVSNYINITDIKNINIVDEPLNEIKVNSPRPFTYDAYYYDEDDESAAGELYFNGELLDGDAVYSYGFSGEEKIYYIAFYINTPTYARLFNSLSLSYLLSDIFLQF
jgi:hypothetical protein